MECEEIYLQWRWAIYNQIDISFLQLCIEMPHILVNPYGEMSLSKKYSPMILDNYRNKKFEVSKNQIELYDKYVIESYDHFFEMYSKHLFLPFKRSVFIENCYLIVEKYNREDLIEKIKTNLIYLHWWDVLTSDELIQSIVNNYFLKSTQKLIDSKLLFNYFQRRFNSKEVLITYVLQNFYPSDSLLEYMKIESRGSLAFDYNWLFNNDFKRSIRIFENECRYEFNEKVIGCFYNEDLLFREIKRTFGKSYKVISQGSPAWLTPQRFDIYCKL